MPADLPRDRAYQEVTRFLTDNRTNAIGQNFVWRAVNVALDTFEAELNLDVDERVGYAVMHEGVPLMVLPTRRLARGYLRYWRRTSGAKKLRIATTAVR